MVALPRGENATCSLLRGEEAAGRHDEGGEKADAPITNKGYIALSVIIFLLLSAVLFFYTQRVGRHVDSTIEDFRQQVRTAEEEKMRIKHALTQNTAHELKTPLASINGYLETLAAHPDLSLEQRQQFLGKCMSQAQRMTALLSDMSTLTRLDNMQPELMEKQPIDLTLIATQAIDDVRPILEQKHIALTFNLPPQMPAQGDYSLMYSVFRNILDNAILYSGCTAIAVAGKALYEFAIATMVSGWNRSIFRTCLSVSTVWIKDGAVIWVARG